MQVELPVLPDQASGPGGTCSSDAGVRAPAIRSVIWDPTEAAASSKVAAVAGNHISVYDLGAGGAPLTSFTTIGRASGGGAGGGDSGADEIGAVVWDPHMTNHIVGIQGKSVVGWDIRTAAGAGAGALGRNSYSVPNAHTERVRGLDYNPNKPYHIVTGGDDCRVLFWDLRKCAEPVWAIPDQVPSSPPSSLFALY